MLNLADVKADCCLLSGTTEKNQTPEICLAAIKSMPCAISHVINQTPELCRAAIDRDGLTLRYIINQTPELCLLAVKKEKMATQFIRNMDVETLRYLVENNIPFDLRKVKKNIPDDLKLLLVLNYGVDIKRFE